MDQEIFVLEANEEEMIIDDITEAMFENEIVPLNE